MEDEFYESLKASSQHSLPPHKEQPRPQDILGHSAWGWGWGIAELHMNTYLWESPYILPIFFVLFLDITWEVVISIQF